jgi:hypothetical protein
MTRFILGLAAAVVLSACGGPGNMSGTVAGIKLDVKDSAFLLVKNQAGDTVGMFLAMADQPDICGTLKANRQPKNTTAVLFSMVRYTDQGTTLAPDVGDYTVINMTPPRGGNYAGALFSHTDTNCTSTIAQTAATGSSGLIKLTSMKAEANGYAQGSFDITFGASDKVTGSFSAKFCELSTLPVNPNCE